MARGKIRMKNGNKMGVILVDESGVPNEVLYHDHNVPEDPALAPKQGDPVKFSVRKLGDNTYLAYDLKWD